MMHTCDTFDFTSNTTKFLDCWSFSSFKTVNIPLILLKERVSKQVEEETVKTRQVAFFRFLADGLRSVPSISSSFIVYWPLQCDTAEVQNV